MSSPVTYVVLLSLIGVSALIAGVFILCGTGWALVAAGILSLMLAICIIRGMANG